jgi:putative peptidoglycan lipid II flippase
MVNKAKRFLASANGRQTPSGAIIIAVAYRGPPAGVVRGRLLVSHFGSGPELSAYYAAFRLPELLFTLLVSGAFAVAFIPVLTDKLHAAKHDEAWEITSTLLNLLVLATIVGAVGIIILADPLTTLITPGFDRHTHDLAVTLTRIMSVTPILFAVSSILGSVQQAFNRFLIFSLAGVLYNVGIIAGILVFAPHFGIYGVAWGVVIGVILQALLQVLGLAGLGFRWRPVLSTKLPAVRQTLKLMLPRSIDQGIDQINYSFETLIGSTISAGAIGQFGLANDLKNVPLVLIGSSITTAVFPRLSRAAATAREHLIEAYVSTARLILFLAIPSALFAFVARGYIVRLLYGFGDPDTAATLGAFAGSIVFTSLFMLVSRVYYAMQDTKTPLYTSLGSIPLNIALSFILSRHYGVMGLAISASIVAALETSTLVFLLRWRQGHFGERQIISGGLRMLVAAGIMAGVVYVLISQMIPLYALDRGFLVLAPKFALILIIAAVCYLVPCYVLRVPEAHQFIKRLRDVLNRTLNLT